MDNLFETGAVRIYQSEWTPISTRKFKDAELQSISSAIVVTSKFGRSVQFNLPKGKAFIPIEPTCPMNVGQTLNPKDLTLVNLQYSGQDPERQGKQILRVRIEISESPKVLDFNNPFGI